MGRNNRNKMEFTEPQLDFNEHIIRRNFKISVKY
jgi:hypothetical protein